MIIRMSFVSIFLNDNVTFDYFVDDTIILVQNCIIPPVANTIDFCGLHDVFVYRTSQEICAQILYLRGIVTLEKQSYDVEVNHHWKQNSDQ